MKLLLINGANFNMLGLREPDKYGNTSLADIENSVINRGKELGAEVDVYQSNHEGDLVDKIQAAFPGVDGIVINPGAYTHTSVAIHDALEMFTGKKIEVHLSKVDDREDFRKVNFIRSVCDETFAGRLELSYVDAINYLKNTK